MAPDMRFSVVGDRTRQRFEHMVTTSSLADDLQGVADVERQGWELVAVISYVSRSPAGGYGDTATYVRHYWKRPCQQG
jgi:hypothetical protein